MTKKLSRVLKGVCTYVCLLNIMLFVKTKDNGIWIGIYFTSALIAKFIELILWRNEPEN
jgi:hypothetical protein